MVTVVVTTLDRLRFLPEAVASVRAQEGVEHQLVVVDSGSTDGTLEWLEREGLETVRIERDPDRTRPGNISTAREAGFARARGELVWWLDDDDRLRPGALELLAGALERHPEAVAAIGARFVFGERVPDTRIDHPRRPLLRDVRAELLLGWCPVPGQTLCRASAVREAGGWDEHVPNAEDLDLWARLFALGPVALRPEIVLEYRMHHSRKLLDPAGEHEALMRRYAVPLLGARGESLRDAGFRWETAKDELARGEPRRALRSAARAVVREPLLVRSPVMRAATARLVARSLRRSFR